MKFLPSLRDIKRPPPPLHLVDMALLLGILPHLSHLRFPMLVFLLLSLLAIVRLRTLSKSWVSLLKFFGLVSVILSFYSDFTFSSLGNFTLFLSLLNALLIYAVVLQRLEGKLNFYLAFSPGLLLVLSFFLHNSISMLLYMVFVLSMFLLFFVWNKMQTSLDVALKLMLSIFAYSLPIVALLFMVFPRISFDKVDYGFRDELSKRSGHDGVMSLGSDALLVPSKAIVMEVYFDKKPPKNRNLYFRGTTLYVDDNVSFKQLKKSATTPLKTSHKASDLEDEISYNITLYPTYQKWVYALDIPSNVPKKSSLLFDYTIIHQHDIKSLFRYKLHSYLHFSMKEVLDENVKKAALQVDKQRDIISAQKAKELIDVDDKKTLENLMHYFSTLELTYTLKPDEFDKSKPIDSFLFGTKKGYCVHFSAAFTYMARVANLPTRVVTGYLINTNEAYENYLVVRENAAHAWVEVYLKESGWVRVETTAFAAYVEDGALDNILDDNLSTLGTYFKEINLQIMYAKYMVETWILEYSRVKQMQILEDLLGDWTYALKFSFSLVLFIVVSIVLALFIQSYREKDKILQILTPLFRRTRKRGYVKKDTQSMHDFFEEIKALYPAEKIDAIDTLYHQLKYSKERTKENILHLKEKIKELK